MNLRPFLWLSFPVVCLKTLLRVQSCHMLEPINTTPHALYRRCVQCLLFSDYSMWTEWQPEFRAACAKHKSTSSRGFIMLMFHCFLSRCRNCHVQIQYQATLLLLLNFLIYLRAEQSTFASRLHHCKEVNTLSLGQKTRSRKQAGSRHLVSCYELPFCLNSSISCFST